MSDSFDNQRLYASIKEKGGKVRIEYRFAFMLDKYDLSSEKFDKLSDWIVDHDLNAHWKETLSIDEIDSIYGFWVGSTAS